MLRCTLHFYCADNIPFIDFEVFGCFSLVNLLSVLTYWDYCHEKQRKSFKIKISLWYFFDIFFSGQRNKVVWNLCSKLSFWIIFIISHVSLVSINMVKFELTLRNATCKSVTFVKGSITTGCEHDARCTITWGHRRLLCQCRD